MRTNFYLNIWEEAAERLSVKLELLPDELINLTDPRLVVADGTRLPEDIEAWTRFVKTNGGKS